MPTVRPRSSVYLWEFLLELLDGQVACPAISWVNRDNGVFVLKDQGEIAKLWGKVKGRPQMDKIKLGRAMRYYYKKKLLAKVPRRKAMYRFVKLDLLEPKKQNASQPHDSDLILPEIDLNDDDVLDLIGDETTSDASSFDLEAEYQNNRIEENLLRISDDTMIQDELSQGNVPTEGIPIYANDSLQNLFQDVGNGNQDVWDYRRDTQLSSTQSYDFSNKLTHHNISYHCYKGNTSETYNFNNNFRSNDRITNLELFYYPDTSRTAGNIEPHQPDYHAFSPQVNHLTNRNET